MSYMEDKVYRDFVHDVILTDDQLQEFYERFTTGIRMGLGKHTNKQADMKCYITYVQDLPTGDEVGKYLALDLGGSNFRVLLITLKGQHMSDQDSKTFTIPDAVRTGPGKQLFDHIALCLSEFVRERRIEDEVLPLGFTFSFPCMQLGLEKALLVRWTKGFNCSGVVGQDVGMLLRDAIMRRRDTKIDIMGILNDTTGTLMSCAHREAACRIGLIVGTGCNACYLERSQNVDLLPEQYHNKSHIIINVEWGAFGDGGCLDFIRTDYDKYVDVNSLNKGTQIFEKMLSGMYLGELVRLILLRAAKENLIFASCSTRARMIHILQCQENIIETRHLTEIESDPAAELQNTKRVLKELFNLKNPTTEDCYKVKFTCECISRRSGQLVGAALSGLINKMGEPKVVVAVDGSVFRLHPRYSSYIREVMEKFVDHSTAYDLMLSEDGSGRGAGLVAAVASKFK